MYISKLDKLKALMNESTDEELNKAIDIAGEIIEYDERKRCAN